MFLYHLNHSFINQTIVTHEGQDFVIGECMTDMYDNYYLVLGDSIFREHLYKITQAPAVLYPCVPTKAGSSKALTRYQLLTVPTIKLIHHLVYEYYTSYANIIKLYLPDNIPKLLSKSPSKSYWAPQSCIIMPDRRTIINNQQRYDYALDQAIGSQHSISQDIKLFWNIKSGLTSQIVCTPWECFWDYHTLSEITLIDPHKRYYKSQKDPRYDIMRVCELMAHYYECALKINS